MRRRDLLAAACAVPASAWAAIPRAGGRGPLMLIGGAEDRSGERVVLRRFLELCRHPAPRIAVLPVASAYAEFAWGRYDAALTELGVADRRAILPVTREDSDDPRWAAALASADGVLVTGGNQRRLVELISGSAIERALHDLHAGGAACIAGTSAGAAVMSQRMLTGRSLSAGLGLLPGVIVDQHFSERRRIGRLVAAVVRHPGLIGVGVDEDTALVLHPGRGYEVVGAGGVTVVDARGLEAPIEDAEFDLEALLQQPSIRVQRVEHGTVYERLDGLDDTAVPAVLWAEAGGRAGAAPRRG